MLSSSHWTSRIARLPCSYGNESDFDTETKEELLAALFELVAEPQTAAAIEGTAFEVTDAEVIDSAPAAGDDGRNGNTTSAVSNGGDSGERWTGSKQATCAPIVLRVQTLSRKLRYEGPSNDDELHAWIVTNIGVDIPREPVCQDHVAPFKFLADLFFERVPSALALANRGGSKTFIVALLHFLNSTYKAGCGSLSFGATEAQGNRCYSNIEDWCFEREKSTGRRTDTVLPFIRDKPKKSQTVWKTGSVVEVVAGSENAVSGPHPAKAHADEIDQMEIGVWNQSRGMAVTNRASGPLPRWMAKYNGMIPPQDIATSTRNSTKGLMQDLLEEIEEDIEGWQHCSVRLSMRGAYGRRLPRCRTVAPLILRCARSA